VNGILEYWSTGILGKNKDAVDFLFLTAPRNISSYTNCPLSVNPLFHYSIIPSFHYSVRGESP
jgi:hypothetical protein